MAKRQRPHGTGCLFKRSADGVWIAKFFAHDGRRPELSTRTTCRDTAQRIMARWIDEQAKRRTGLADPRDDKYAAANRLPLSQHLAEWRTALTAKGVTAQQVGLVLNRAGLILASIKAERLADLSASALQSAIGELQRAGKSLQTCQHYLRAIKQFSRWLNRDGRTRADALAHLSGYNAATDRRRERRALDGDELARLIDATEHGPTLRELSGVDRAMLYRVACGTGYRANELRSLTAGSFRLDDDRPSITLGAASSKRRRADVQPIREDLADVLAVWLTGKPTDAPLWPGLWHKHGAKLIRADLRQAKARWIRETPIRAERRERRDSDILAVVDAAGRVADFHALRVSYITALVKGGASVKVCQELARHSTPTLTLGVYTRLGINDVADGLDALPSIKSTRPDEQAGELLATGSDGNAHKSLSYPRHIPRQLGRETAERGGTRRNEPKATTDDADARKPLPDVSLCNAAQEKRRGGDSNPGSGYEPAKRFSKPSPDAVSACQTRVGADPPDSNPDTSTPETTPDAELHAAVDRWQGPERIKAAIHAMIDAATVLAIGGQP